MEPHAAPQAAARQHVRVVLTPAFCRAECISIYDEPLMYPPPPPHAARWPPCCVRVTLIMRVHHSGPYKYFVFHSLPATAEQRPRLVFSGAHGSTGGGRVFCIPIRLHSSSRVPSSRACISAPRLPLLRSARRPQQRAAGKRGARCGVRRAWRGAQHEGGRTVRPGRNDGCATGQKSTRASSAAASSRSLWCSAHSVSSP